MCVLFAVADPGGGGSWFQLIEPGLPFRPISEWEAEATSQLYY